MRYNEQKLESLIDKSEVLDDNKSAVADEQQVIQNVRPNRGSVQFQQLLAQTNFIRANSKTAFNIANQKDVKLRKMKSAKILRSFKQATKQDNSLKPQSTKLKNDIYAQLTTRTISTRKRLRRKKSKIDIEKKVQPSVYTIPEPHIPIKSPKPKLIITKRIRIMENLEVICSPGRPKWIMTTFTQLKNQYYKNGNIMIRKGK